MQFGMKIILTGPLGDRAVFNDTTDADNVATATEVTGLDSPDIRENASDLVQTDGGIHGDFFAGRRPIVINALVHGHATATERNAKLLKLKRAAMALRGDATLRFTMDGMPEQFCKVRLNQPMRATSAWNKEVQVPLVAADPRLYSWALNSQEVTAVAATGTDGRSYDRAFNIDYGPALPNGQLLVTNAGTWETYPVFTITGPGLNPAIYNLTTSQALYFGYNLGAGETLVVDTLNRTIRLNGTSDRYYSLDQTRSAWFPLRPGLNDIRVAFSTFSTGAKLRVDWRDAWL